LVSNAEIIAVAALKRFRRMLVDYDGPPEKLKEFLLKKLQEWEEKGDNLLAGAFTDLFEA